MKKTTRTMTLLLLLTITASFALSCKKSKVIATIDDNPITLEEFNNYYYAQNKLYLGKDKNEEIDKLAKEKRFQKHPTMNKSLFLDFIISRKLLMEKANSDNEIDKKTLETIKKLANLQGHYTYYLGHKTKDKIDISDEEINQVYERNKQILKNAPLDAELRYKIKQEIFMQKTQANSRMILMNLVAESKVNKEGFQDMIKKITESKSDKLDLDVKSDKVLVTIDDEKITQAELFDFAITQTMIGRDLDRKEATETLLQKNNARMIAMMMENLVGLKLITKKSETSEEIDQTDLNAMVDLSVMQGVATFYLSKKLGKDITVTDAEVDKFYKSNIDRFKGVPISDQVIQQIKGQIKMQKLEQKSQQYVLDLVAQSSVKRDAFNKYLKEQKDEKKEEDNEKKDK